MFAISQLFAHKLQQIIYPRCLRFFNRFYVTLCATRTFLYLLLTLHASIANTNVFSHFLSFHKQTKEDGKWRFQCQHGKSECDGNMAQACAIKAIQELNKPDEQDLLAQVLGCAMNTNYPPTAIPQV